MTYKTIIDEFEELCNDYDANERIIIGAMASEICRLRQALVDIQKLPQALTSESRYIAMRAYNNGI